MVSTSAEEPPGRAPSRPQHQKVIHGHVVAPAGLNVESRRPAASMAFGSLRRGHRLQQGIVWSGLFFAKLGFLLVWRCARLGQVCKRGPAFNYASHVTLV